MSALSWSGGKDSALALHELRTRSGSPPRALLTTVTAEYGRISMHGVRRELLLRQARAAGLPLVQVEIPAGCSNDVYEQRMGRALAEAPLADAQTIAFGDLFLADIREYREEQLRRIGKQATFPLWGRDTSALAREFIAGGFEAVLVCVDPRQLDSSFAGRRFDAELLADLPPDVDPCGENGEFHTFVHAGPIFTAPIACHVGETVERDGFVFCDVVPEDGVIAETDRLVVRPWRLDEADRFFDMYRRTEVARWIGGRPMADRAEAEPAIQLMRDRLAADPRFGGWAIVERAAGVVAGTVLLKPLPDGAGEIEIGWHLHPESWGRGLATEAARALLEHGFALGLEEIWAVTRPENRRSIRVCEKLGMRLLGVTDRWYHEPSLMFWIGAGADRQPTLGPDHPAPA